MFRKITILAVISVLSLVTVVEAQHTPTPPPTTKINVAGHVNGSSLKRPVVIGWNYLHPSNCYVFDAGPGVLYLEVFTLEGDNFYTPDPRFLSVIAPACQTGNYVAFYVYDSNGDWNAAYTYTHQ